MFSVNFQEIIQALKNIAIILSKKFQLKIFLLFGFVLFGWVYGTSTSVGY